MPELMVIPTAIEAENFGADQLRTRQDNSGSADHRQGGDAGHLYDQDVRVRAGEQMLAALGPPVSQRADLTFDPPCVAARLASATCEPVVRIGIRVYARRKAKEATAWAKSSR